MAAADTFGSIFTVGMGILGVVLLVAVVATIVYLVFGKKKGFKDSMKEQFKEMKADAKINLPDNMLDLYRLPIPFLGDFLGRIVDGTSRKLVVEELRSLFNRSRRAVYLGEITGFNRIDMQATLEDILMPDGKYSDPIKSTDLTKEDLEKVKSVILECGNYLNFIVYKPKKKGFLNMPQEEGVFAFDDMLLGLESEDGNVALLGEGTERIAVYFSMPSAYPHRTKVLLTNLIERGWIRWAMRLEAVHIESTEDAMRLDSNSQKYMAFSALAAGGARKSDDKK